MDFNLFVFFSLSMICLSVFVHFIPCLQSTECSITNVNPLMGRSRNEEKNCRKMLFKVDISSFGLENIAPTCCTHVFRFSVVFFFFLVSLFLPLFPLSPCVRFKSFPMFQNAMLVQFVTCQSRFSFLFFCLHLLPVPFPFGSTLLSFISDFRTVQRFVEALQLLVELFHEQIALLS